MNKKRPEQALWAMRNGGNKAEYHFVDVNKIEAALTTSRIAVIIQV